MKNVQDVVVRIAEEFNKTQNIQDKNQPGGYVGLDEEGKIPISALDLSAINSPQAKLISIVSDFRVKAREPFTLIFEATNFTVFDAIVIDDVFLVCEFEDNIVKAHGTLENIGFFEVYTSRFANDYKSELQVQVTDVIWNDFRETFDFPLIVNNAGDVMQDSKGAVVYQDTKSPYGEMLFSDHVWDRSDNKTLDVIVHLEGELPLFFFGIAPLDLNLKHPRMLTQTEIVISTRGTLLGKVSSNRFGFSLNNRSGKYRFSFINSGSTIEVYKVEDSDFAWSEGELVYTQDVNTHGTSEKLVFMMSVPTTTGGNRITAYREY